MTSRAEACKLLKNEGWRALAIGTLLDALPDDRSRLQCLCRSLSFIRYFIAVADRRDHLILDGTKWAAGNFISGDCLVDRMSAVACSFPYPARKQILHCLVGIQSRNAGAPFNGIDTPLRGAVIAASASRHDDVGYRGIEPSDCRTTKGAAIN